MKAELLRSERVVLGKQAFMELVLRRVPRPVAGSVHGYKYRLALVVDGECVLRYDNERGKGDHRHIGAIEQPYRFVDVEKLVEDFRVDIVRWTNENRKA